MNFRLIVSHCIDNYEKNWMKKKLINDEQEDDTAINI